jgi:HEAT repeat protein
MAPLSHHPQPFVRAAILRALADLDCPDTFPILETAARGDPEFDVRLAGIAGLGRFGLRGQDSLLAALQDRSNEVVLTAIKTLSDIRCVRALPLLEPLSRSSHPSIRFFAAHAIDQIRNTL